MIYFDNAATTKPSKEVIDTFIKLNEQNFANPSSPHLFAFEGTKILAKANKIILKYLNLDPDTYEIIYTSGASESNNLAIKGYLSRNKNNGDVVITSKYEHPSVTYAVLEYKEGKIEPILLNANKDGNIDLTELKQILSSSKVSMISFMLVNNETGDILNLKEVRKLIDEVSPKTIFVSDCTQSVGKIDFDYSIFDMITLSLHKIEGLKSAGLLIKKKSIFLNCEISGGGQQNNLRSGTLNIPLIASNSIAIKNAILSLPERSKKAQELKNYLVKELNKIEEIHINTNLNNSSPFILNFSTTVSKASVVVEELSKKEIYVSTTSACSSHSASYSKVLKNMGFDDKICQNSIRLSFSGEEDITQGEEFIKEFTRIISSIKK